MQPEGAILAVEGGEATSSKALDCIEYNNDMTVKDIFLLHCLPLLILALLKEFNSLYFHQEWEMGG